MTETLDTKGKGDTQTVSIAGGSLLVIGFMLWFFTSGTKSELKELQKEMQEFKISLEKQANAFQQLKTSIDAIATSGKESSVN